MDIDEDDEDEGQVDLSRCEQLLKCQLYGCGLGILLLLRIARENPRIGLSEMLDKLDLVWESVSIRRSTHWKSVLETVGCLYRPRKFEVGQALMRMRGAVLEELPMVDDGSEAAAALEAERKKRQLAELWQSRRGNKKNNV